MRLIQIDQTDRTDHDTDQIYQTDRTDQTDQTDHDLDHLDLSLPLWDVVQDLYGTDPPHETRPRSRRLYGSHPAT